MVEQYTHTLIAPAEQLAPAPAQIQEFVVGLIALGVVPGEVELVLRTKSDKVRTGINPFTGEQMTFPIKKASKVQPGKIAARLKGLQNFELAMSGFGHPKLPPLPLQDVSVPYHVGVTLVRSSELRSTSDTYNGFKAPLKEVPAFGEICEAAPIGYFSNLHRNELIEVPHAGAAHFWIEFELGKFLFPSLDGGLSILAPAIVQLAEQVFAFPMVQGLHWVP